MDSKKFFACDWRGGIEETRKLSVKGKVPLNGEDEVLKTIDRFLGI